MIHCVPEILYRFSIRELPALEELWHRVRQLSTVPPDLDDLVGAEARSTLERGLAELEKLPDTDVVTREEKVTYESKRAEDRALAASTRGCIIRGRGHYVRFCRDAEVTRELERAASAGLGGPCKLTGDFLYRPSAYREWHSNCFNLPGWRMYVVDVDRPKSSYFRFVNPKTGELETLWDEPGNVTFFRIDPTNLLYHCVAAREAHRWSKGFVIPDTWKAAAGLA